MLLADGDFSVFLTRPIRAGLLGVVALLLAALLSPMVVRGRKQALAE